MSMSRKEWCRRYMSIPKRVIDPDILWIRPGFQFENNSCDGCKLEIVREKCGYDAVLCDEFDWDEEREEFCVPCGQVSFTFTDILHDVHFQTGKAYDGCRWEDEDDEDDDDA